MCICARTKNQKRTVLKTIFLQNCINIMKEIANLEKENALNIKLLNY